MSWFSYHLFRKQLQQYFQLMQSLPSWKFHIIKARKASNLDKITELISKPCHKNKYFPMNIDLRLQ